MFRLYRGLDEYMVLELYPEAISQAEYESKRDSRYVQVYEISETDDEEEFLIAMFLEGRRIRLGEKQH